MEKLAAGFIVLSQDGKREVIGKKKESSSSPLAGKWHIPAETAEAGESLWDTVRRGAEQELGIWVNGLVEIDRIVNPYGVEVHWFVCGPFGNEKLTPGSDLAEAKWVERKNVLEEIDPLAAELLPEKVKQYLESVR